MRRLNHHLTCWNSQALGQRSVLQEFPDANKGLDVPVIIIAIVLIVLAATAVVLVYPRPSAPSSNGSSNNNGSNGNGTNGNGSGSNTNSPTQSMRFQAASASDRDFPGQVAYTIMVPDGWVGQPNVERYTHPLGERTSTSLRMTRPGIAGFSSRQRTSRTMLNLRKDS